MDGSYGQSSDSNLDNYNPFGIELIDGYIELVKKEDPLLTASNSRLG